MPSAPACAMHPTLARQLKRLLAPSEGDGVASQLQALSDFLVAAHAPQDLQALAEGLPGLLTRVDSTYQQFERDLELRSRSLSLSSNELIATNERLQSSLESRDRALSELQSAARRMLGGGDDEPERMEALDGARSLESLAALINYLVKKQGQDKAAMQILHADLANQKFALDQHAIVSITDLAGRITYANQRFCDISGYEEFELIGRSHSLVNSGLHPREFFQNLWQTIAAGRVWRGEVRNRAKNGSYYWVDATIVPLSDASGKPDSYIAIRTDITHLKTVEARLEEQVDFVEKLLEAIPVPIYLKDREGRYLRFNRAFEKLFHVRRSDWIGRTVFDLLSEESANIHHGRDQEVLRSAGIQEYETHLTDRQNQPLDVIYRKAALRDSKGQASGLIGTILDISERKRVERELVDARIAAESANQAKSQFLANMSHEIRTPMNGIIGMTELALDTDLTPAQREYLSIVQTSANSLLTVLNDILDFSKIEAGKLAIEHLSFPLNDVLNAVVQPMRPRVASKGLSLSLVLSPEIPPWVEGDPGRVRQVLGNLCENALKFTSKGGIRLSASWTPMNKATKDAWLQFSVEDSGIGIPAEQLPRIFESFSQADNSTTRKYGGTGLGLSICRRLAELMGGELWAESTPGVGSVFHLRIPSRETQPRKRPLEIAESAAVRPLRILLVEDHPVNQKLAADLLGRWGHETTLATDGVQAIELFAPGRFDVILMDMLMPVLGGIEATALIREREQLENSTPVPIIAMTANAMEGDRERCIAAGMNDHIAKPLDTTALRRMLTRLGSTLPDAPSPHTTAVPEKQPSPPPTPGECDYGALLAAIDPFIITIAGEVFITEMPEDLAKAEEAARTGDLPTLKRAVHTLKSNIALFGAQALADVAQTIESDVAAGSYNADALSYLMVETQQLVSAVQARLQAG